MNVTEINYHIIAIMLIAHLMFLNVFFCLACNIVPENWHICVNKGIIYLLTLSSDSSLGISQDHCSASTYLFDQCFTSKLNITLASTKEKAKNTEPGLIVLCPKLAEIKT